MYLNDKSVYRMDFFFFSDKLGMKRESKMPISVGKKASTSFGISEIKKVDLSCSFDFCVVIWPQQDINVGIDGNSNEWRKIFSEDQ